MPSLKTLLSGPQRGPAERGHVKKCQNLSKSVKIFSTFFAQGAKKRSKIIKKRQVCFLAFFDTFRAAPVFRPLLGGSDLFPSLGCYFAPSSYRSEIHTFLSCMPGGEAFFGHIIELNSL